jgi:hypothetical protein
MADDEFTGLAPEGPEYLLLPPLGMTLAADDRAWLIRRYGEPVVADWERRNAEFLATQAAAPEPDDDNAESNLTDDQLAELVRGLGYEV